MRQSSAMRLAFWVVLVVLVVTQCNVPYDNTDDLRNKKRSGMSLYTDHLTGCQYLKGGLFGAMIKRTDKSGKHLGCK